MIKIEWPEHPRLGGCGGDPFGGNSYASVEVDGKPWGFLVGHHADADIFAGRFTWSVESTSQDRGEGSGGVEIYAYLGRRKNMKTAHAAAAKEVRRILSGN